MVKEKIHPVTGEKYIEGSQKIIMESGVLLTPSEFSQSTMMSKEEVGALMQELAGREDRYKFDYRYALTTGVLRHKAELPVQKPKEEVEKEPEAVPVVKKNLITPATIILLWQTGFLADLLQLDLLQELLWYCSQPQPLQPHAGSCRRAGQSDCLHWCSFCLALL